MCPLGGDCVDCGYRSLSPQTPPSPAQSPALPGAVCSNGCDFAGDGDCDDGGDGATYEFCPLGTDCDDCGGGRLMPPPPSPWPHAPPGARELCADDSDRCEYLLDGECDDGGAGSTYAACPVGSDCSDCGPRALMGNTPPVLSPPMQSPAMQTLCYDLENSCGFLADGDCDDGGAGSEYASCALGFDCADCGPRSQVLSPPMAIASSPSPSPVDISPDAAGSPGVLCSDGCLFDSDGECDDGGVGSTYGACDLGTDCSDCGERNATSGRRRAAERAPLQAGRRAAADLADLDEEPFKPQPPRRSHWRSLQGCAAVSPSPPLPASPPSAPLPSVPPLPPFAPLRSNETVATIPVVSISIGIVLQGSLESLNRDDIHGRLQARVGCYDPCTFTTTFTPGSVVVTAEATVPQTQAAVASTVESSFQALTAGTAQDLGDVVGTKVQGLSSQVVARMARRAQVVPLPSPPPPPQVPSPQASTLPTAVVVGAAVGGIVAVACFGVIIWLLLRQQSKKVKPVASYS